jgi:hypothetical protein
MSTTVSVLQHWMSAIQLASQAFAHDTLGIMQEVKTTVRLPILIKR